MSASPALAAVVGRVPHYGSTAAAVGSVIFLILLAAFLAMGFRRRRR
ncbi:hypothetical protein KDL01_38810 [Actinospica durhamensis]|uniref:Uncharacterized protein n=1 Tax=Actinospica durhamensis TaxID=1508375 RepID=A0A941IUL6_9ACTN|nr:hypothetical protein [Actinospica durhamensis]MBR7839277.1 hypothetical protein [Actinospica durhamensis]